MPGILFPAEDCATKMDETSCNNVKHSFFKTQECKWSEGFQNRSNNNPKSVEGFQSEMTPSRLVKSVKFWNYLTTIINAKNASCPRFPLTMDTLKILYDDDDGTTVKNKDPNLTLTRNSMGDLTIQNLQDLTDLVDAYTDEPIWKDKMVGFNNDTLKKDIKMGGSKISQGESIHYGNFELYVGKKSIEFIVNHYDDTNLKNKMNNKLCLLYTSPSPRD